MGTTQIQDVVAETLKVTDTFTIPNGAVPRTKVAQESLVAYPIPFSAWRVWDAPQTALPGTSATDDLGVYDGTFGTGTPYIATYDVKAAGAVTLYARAMLALPAEYDAGQTAQIRFSAGMLTTVADTTATIDVSIYESDKDTTSTGDLIDTAAQSINSLTFANKDFTITPTNLAVGDELDVRVAIAVNDGATGTAVIAAIGYAALLLDIRG